MPTGNDQAHLPRTGSFKPRLGRHHPVYVGEVFKDGRYIAYSCLDDELDSRFWLAEDNTWVLADCGSRNSTLGADLVNKIAGSSRWVSLEIRRAEVPFLSEELWPQNHQMSSPILGHCNLRGLDLPAANSEGLLGTGVVHNPQHTAALHDFFMHSGPEGKRLCLVYELLGPSLEREFNLYQDLRKNMRYPFKQEVEIWDALKLA